MLYLESINRALYDLLSDNTNVVLIGEDLSDPYGGAFKVTKGLSTKFPTQVISTPISEQAITGAAIGMAMRGMKPIVEIMFGDFMTLCVDQIVNHATKYNWMFNEQVNVPIVIRAPMGGGRGYGPTHSQSLESIFMSIPELTICAPSIYHDPGLLLKQCVLNNNPVLFIENKRSYSQELQVNKEVANKNMIRTVVSNCDNYGEVLLLTLYEGERPDIVIITYGGMAEYAVSAAVKIFMDDEIVVNTIVLSFIKPLNIQNIISDILMAEKVMVLEEGNKIGGWGAEVLSQIHESNPTKVINACRIGSKDTPIPASLSQENDVLPSIELIVKTIKNMFK